MAVGKLSGNCDYWVGGEYSGLQVQGGIKVGQPLNLKFDL